MIIGVALVYLNAPANLVKFFGVPPAIAGGLLAILGLPVAYYVFVRRERLIFDLPFGLMLAFLAVLLASSMSARDASLALQWIVTFVLEGLALYFVIINSVRSTQTLQRVIVVLLCCAALLGALSLYQVVTGDYSNEFGGLARRQMVFRDGRTMLTVRAQGQVGQMNRFAQTLLVLAPLAFLHAAKGRSGRSRFFGALALALIGCGVLLTYSRSGFLALAGVIVAMPFMRMIKLRWILVPVCAGALAVVILAPRYIDRLNSLRGVAALFDDGGREVEADDAIRGRMTEMLSALNVAADHPILGVGPGQYAPFYSVQYQLDPDVAFRFLPRQRRAHSLYFEIAAETGVIGLGIFLLIIMTVMTRLYRRRDSQVVAALGLGLLGYLICGVFSHLSYQSYFWLLLGLCGAAIQLTTERVDVAA